MKGKLLNKITNGQPRNNEHRLITTENTQNNNFNDTIAFTQFCVSALKPDIEIH